MGSHRSRLAILGITAILFSCHAQTASDTTPVSEANKNGERGVSEETSSKTVRLVGSIHLPGNGGFTDYLIVAPEMQRLYAGYRTENKLVVVDTQTNTVIGSVS